MNEDKIINFGKYFMKTPATLFKIVLYFFSWLREKDLVSFVTEKGLLTFRNKNC